MREQSGRADQRLGRHAAGIQAVAAHALLFHQRHFGLDRRRDVGRDQTGAAGADDDEVAIEVARFLPAGKDLVSASDFDDFSGDQRQGAEQQKRAEHGGGKNTGERIDLAKLGSGIHISRRSRKHAKLADPVESARFHCCQPEQEVDQKEGKGRNQPQGKEIESALVFDSLVDRGQTLAEALHDPVAQEKARHDQRQRGAERRGERGDQCSPEHPEDRPAGQCQQRSTGQGNGGA